MCVVVCPCLSSKKAAKGGGEGGEGGGGVEGVEGGDEGGKGSEGVRGGETARGVAQQRTATNGDERRREAERR